MAVLSGIMLTALIVDDEPKGRVLLLKLLKEYCPQVQIAGEATGVEEAYTFLRKHPEINLLFLDIQMQDGYGFDLLERFSEPHFNVIFVTAFGQYALQAIRFSALDYLVKPINIKELIAAVHKAEQDVNKRGYKELYAHFLNNFSAPNKKGRLADSKGLCFC